VAVPFAQTLRQSHPALADILQMSKHNSFRLKVSSKHEHCALAKHDIVCMNVLDLIILAKWRSLPCDTRNCAITCNRKEQAVSVLTCVAAVMMIFAQLLLTPNVK
jgi:hypothetical protein